MRRSNEDLWADIALTVMRHRREAEARFQRELKAHGEAREECRRLRRQVKKLTEALQEREAADAASE